MIFFVKNFKWLMLASGLMTCTMLLGLFTPGNAMQSNFGETLSGQAADIVVRNWAALIGLSGISLLYGSFVENVRGFVLVISGAGKAVFITLILSNGSAFMRHGAGTAVIADSIMIMIFAAFLIARMTGINTRKVS